MASNPTGWGAVGYGLAGGFERDRKALQAQASSKNYNEAAQGSKFEQEAEALRLQNQQLQLQQKMIQNQLVSKDLTYAVDNFVNTGDTEVMNMVIKSNPFLAEKLKKNYGINRVDNFDFIGNPEHRKLAAKDLGLSEDIIKEMLEQDPDVLNDFQKGFVVARGEKGDHLSSLAEFTEQTGYLNQVASHKGEALKKVLDGVKRIGKVMTAKEQKDQRALEYFAKPENQGKTWADFEQEDLGVVPSVEDQKAKEVLKQVKAGKTFKEALKGVTLEKPTKEPTITTASLKDEYANLKVEASKGELPKDKQVRMDVLDKLFSTDNDEKRQILAEGIKITDKYKGKLFDDTINIDDKDIIAAKLYAQQAGIKPDAKENREFKDQFNTVKTGKRLVEEVDKLGNEELSRGLVDTGIQELKKLLSDKDFEEMKPEEKEKALKSINMNTKLGMFLAKYIKNISGTAVADAEYNRLKDLFSGKSFDNIQTLKEGVRSFVGELETQFRDAAQTALLDNPSTTLDLVKRYKDLTKDEVKKEEAPIVTPKEETPVATDTYDSKYEKFKSLIGQVNPNTGKRLVGFEEQAPFNPIYEEVK